MVGEFSRAGRTGHPKRDITNTHVLLFRNLRGRAGLADSSLIELTRRRFWISPIPEHDILHAPSPAASGACRWLACSLPQSATPNQAGSKRTVARCQPRDRLMAAWVSGERRPRNRSPKACNWPAPDRKRRSSVCSLGAGEEKAESKGISSFAIPQSLTFFLDGRIYSYSRAPRCASRPWCKELIPGRSSCEQGLPFMWRSWMRLSPKLLQGRPRCVRRVNSPSKNKSSILPRLFHSRGVPAPSKRRKIRLRLNPAVWIN